MRDDERVALSELLRRIEIILEQSLDFTSTDPDMAPIIVRVLTAAATYFNVLVLEEFGGRAGAARDPALVEQVIGAAFQSFGGHDPHPELFQKAAMLLRGITAGHPFNDGNKRTGFLVAAYYLAQV